MHVVSRVPDSITVSVFFTSQPVSITFRSHYVRILSLCFPVSLGFPSGKFDHSDRLFHSIYHAWLMSSSEASTVNELTPEFFFMPNFLLNGDHFALGTTQSGKVVDDVVLPPWAMGDPKVG